MTRRSDRSGKDYHPPPPHVTCMINIMFQIKFIEIKLSFIVLSTVDVLSFVFINDSNVFCHLFNLDVGIAT